MEAALLLVALASFSLVCKAGLRETSEELDALLIFASKNLCFATLDQHSQ